MPTEAHPILVFIKEVYLRSVMVLNQLLDALAQNIGE